MALDDTLILRIAKRDKQRFISFCKKQGLRYTDELRRIIKELTAKENK